MKKTYTFTDKEKKILRDRIAGIYTEAETAKLLNVPRQYVNDMIARFVMSDGI